MDRIYVTQKTGHSPKSEPQSPLAGLFSDRATEPGNLLRILPLHTNASENDLHACVTKRKLSGGTMSEDGRLARDVMLGLMKTRRKLGISFFAYLGDRLSINGPDKPIPPLHHFVSAKPA